MDNKSKATCFFVLVVPAHTLLCVEKFAHSLQETEVVKEADEHVRFAVPQAVPPPVYRTACHGHVSLYGLKLGSGVGWSEPEMWIPPTRWGLGAKERP